MEVVPQNAPAFEVVLTTPTDVANGIKKGDTMFYHSPTDEPGLKFYTKHPDSTDGFALYDSQVSRREHLDTPYTIEEDEPVAAEPEQLELFEKTVDVVRTLVEDGSTPAVGVAMQLIADAGVEPVVRNPRGGGLKFDGGKVRPGLLINGMPRALLRISDVLTFGAEKYEAHSWKKVENGEERYNDAKLRHMFALATGEEVDSESRIEHLAHELCNGLFLLEKLLVAQES